MSEYKEIKGFKVQTLATDTAASVAATGTWASTSSLNAACREGGGSGGPTTAINVGGYPYPMTSEHWNGSTWATFANLGTPRGKNATAGSYTNAIAGNGSTPGTPGIGIINNVESWNGSSWSEIAEINSIRDSNAMSAGGTNTAVIYFGGNAPGGASVLNESWNGSAWTEVNDLNAARIALTGIGTQTAALAVGGSPDTANTELWNGSAWTEVNNMNTAGDYMGGSSGTQTSALVFGGDPGNTTKTESWDGTSWTEVNNLGTGRDSLKGAGSGSTSALAYGGYTSTDLANSEEWTVTPTANFQQINIGQVYYNSGSNAFKVTKIVYGTGAWASGGAMNTPRAQVAGAGSQGAGIVAGGSGPPPGSQNAELYNGSTWTETTNLSGIARRLQAGTGGGSQSSAISIGGYSAPPSPNGTLNLVEKWDGSSWSEVSEINTARYQAMGGGASNQSAITAGGETAASGETVNTEVWDNSSWTETGDLSSARTQCAGGGPVTSAMCVSQSSSPKGITSTFNGSTWSDVTELNTDRQAVMTMIDNDTTGTVAGGTGPASPNSVLTETWNGTAWTEVADLASGRYNGTGVGISTEGFVAGGGTSATGTTTTEEWTVPASTLNQTIGTS